jgi:RNA polymerase sigma-70 factor (ECF subfamily)
MIQARSDEELVRAVQSGDIPSFETLVRRYQRRLLYYARRFVPVEGSCEEVVQDALFSLYQTIDRVDTTHPVKSYIYAITKNKALSFLRSHREMVRLDDIDVADDDIDFIDTLHNEDRKLSVKHALQNISPSYRTALKLYYFDDLSYKEISSKLHMPLNTVRTHLSRAKAALKQHITTI